MTTEKQKELARLRESLKTFQKAEAELARELGESSVSGLSDTLSREEEAAQLYDRLTPREMVDLYANNRGEWDRVMAAKEAAGVRKLFRRR